MKQDKIEDRNEKKSNIEDFHDLSKRMILNASSINKECESANPTNYAL